ncbi:MAG TPA: efflux RND transporter periplasmic adaptor subunit [Verrucomicrobiae bacterium]|nr:efflux RND transporter periplasmic adaptor subunit [Verrucomicrobiae bacterium]
MKLNFKLSIALGAIALLAAACNKAAPGQPAGGAPPAMPVTVNQPLAKDVVEWDQYQGRLDAVESVEIRARVSGYLESINFKDGEEVKKGDLLFVIDPRPYQAELDRAQADLLQAQTRFELASNDLERAGRLLKAKAISEEDADSRAKAERQAAAAIQSSAASVEIAKINMDYTQVTAPISGRIGRKMITVGNLVNGNQGESTMLATIVSLDPIYCYFDVDESAILKYQQLARAGQQDQLTDGKVHCEIELGDETGFPHKGLLDFVDNRLDPSTGTLRVRGIFANPDRVLQPGFFVRARVPGSSKYPALLIPDMAVGTDQSQKFIYTIDAGDTVQYTPVTLGPLVDGLRVVRSGLHPNDWVIVNGLMTIRPGAKVAPTRQSLNSTNTTAAANP